MTDFRHYAVAYHLNDAEGRIYQTDLVTTPERLDGFLRELHPGATIVVRGVAEQHGRAPFIDFFDRAAWRTLAPRSED